MTTRTDTKGGRMVANACLFLAILVGFGCNDNSGEVETSAPKPAVETANKKLFTCAQSEENGAFYSLRKADRFVELCVAQPGNQPACRADIGCVEASGISDKHTGFQPEVGVGTERKGLLGVSRSALEVEDRFPNMAVNAVGDCVPLNSQACGDPERDTSNGEPYADRMWCVGAEQANGSFVTRFEAEPCELELAGSSCTETAEGVQCVLPVQCQADADCPDADGNVCTGVPSCVDGVCVDGDPIPFVANEGCVNRTCDPVTGEISDEYLHDRCGDGDACNGTEQCEPLNVNADENGCILGQEVVFNDGNPCTDDACITVNGEAVPSSSFEDLLNTPCDDGLVCTGMGETGICVGADTNGDGVNDTATCRAEVACDIPDEYDASCVVAPSCDEQGGCVVDLQADGTACDPEVPSAACVQGACTPLACTLADRPATCLATENGTQAYYTCHVVQGQTWGMLELFQNCPDRAPLVSCRADEGCLQNVCDPADANACVAGQSECVDEDGDGTGECVEIDTDGDLIVDILDNCPNDANPGQEDNDADGIGDACDNCVGVQNVDQSDVDGDGIGDLCEDPENVAGDACDDGLDNDGNGLIDCQEPGCADALNCAPANGRVAFSYQVRPNEGIIFQEEVNLASGACFGVEAQLLANGDLLVTGQRNVDSGCRLNFRDTDGNWIPGCLDVAAPDGSCNVNAPYSVVDLECGGGTPDHREIIVNGLRNGRDDRICDVRDAVIGAPVVCVDDANCPNGQLCGAAGVCVDAP